MNKFAIIDWMTWGFVHGSEEDGPENEGKIMTFEEFTVAEKYAIDNLQTGLWTIVRVPVSAITYLG